MQRHGSGGESRGVLLRSSRRRWWAPDRIDAAVVLAAGLLLLLVLPAGAATRPPFHAGRAGAAAVHVIVDTEPSAVPIATLLELRAPDAVSTFDSSGTIEARASSLWPGRSGTGGPQLLCDFGAPCPEGFPPDYPLTAEAAHPSQPESSTPTGFARATASPDGVASSARPGNVLGRENPLAAAISVGAAAARTSQTFVDGRLVVQAETTLEDLTLGGGQLTIESVVSRTVARAGTEHRSADAALTIAGVRSADGAVVVGHDGITVGGEGNGDAAVAELNARLAEVLADTPLTVRVLGATQETAEGTVTASVYGLQVRVAQGVEGPPAPQLDRLYRSYVLHGTLGQAHSAARAAEDPFALGFGPTGGLDGAADQATTAGTPGPTTGSAELGPPPSATAPGGAGGGLSAGGAATSPPAPSVAPQAGAGEGGAARGDDGWALLGGPAADAARTGYAALAAALVGTVVLSRALGRRLATTGIDGTPGGR